MTSRRARKAILLPGVMTEERLKRAMQQRIFLMDAEIDEFRHFARLRVFGSSGKSPYLIHLNKMGMSCSCPDFAGSDSVFCKHLLFIFYRVLKNCATPAFAEVVSALGKPVKGDILLQYAALTRRDLLADLIHNVNPGLLSVIGEDGIILPRQETHFIDLGGDGDDADDETVSAQPMRKKRRVEHDPTPGPAFFRNETEDCSTCFESLASGLVSVCVNCDNGQHERCLALWCKAKGSNKSISCIFCRSTKGTYQIFVDKDDIKPLIDVV